MPNNKVKTGKGMQGKKKGAGGHIHPNSRRAKQLQRVELRAVKLDVQSRVRRSDEIQEMDRHLYFVHALPSDATSISLIELHGLLEDYINRNEGEMAELERERAARSWRKTEGKGKRETEMDKQREVELAEYKTGFIIPDLTIAENVELCRQWANPAPATRAKNAKGGDPSFLGRIRLVRINSVDKNQVLLEAKGAREVWDAGEGEVEMGEGEEEE